MEVVMYKKMSSSLFFLLLSLAIAMLFTGCSRHSDNTAAPKPAANVSKPFNDPMLQMVGEEEPQSLTSWLIKEVMDGLSEGITSFIGDNTTGRVLNGISGHTDDSGSNAQFQQMTAQLDSIQSQVVNISNQIANLSAQIGLNQAALVTQIAALPLNASANIITSMFNTNAAASTYGYTPPVGNPDAAYGDSDGYMYFANKARNLTPVAKGATGFSTYSTALSSLKAQAQVFYSTKPILPITINLNNIYKVVCPAPGGTPPVLETYASLIIQSTPASTIDPDTGIAYTDAKKAMNGYKLLEQFFAQIISYQIQGNIIRTELRNYTGDTSNAQTDLSTFQGYLSDEVKRFEAAVNFLMINMVDYRNSANYTNDSAAMHTRGLVQDDVYNMVYARSRFFCAQLLSGNVLSSPTPPAVMPVTQSPLASPPINGLHGSIVVPNLYAYQGTSTSPTTPGTITLKFTSYSSSQLGFKNYSTTRPALQPAATAGQFPYTAWNYGDTTQPAHCYPDNNWLFYEFSAPDDFPAGKYRITLVDNGNNGFPWYHTETDFGKVSVLYYDPQNPAQGTGTISPSATNTFKFGSFSGRWNWGYNMMSLAPWTVPSTASLSAYYGIVPNPFSTTFCGVSTQADGSKSWLCPNSYSADEMAIYLDSFFYPQTGDLANKFGMSIPSFTSYDEDEVWYTKNFPFTASIPPGLNLATNVYYNITGTVNSSNFKVDYAYALNNTSTSSASAFSGNYSDSTFKNIVNFQISQTGSLDSSKLISDGDKCNISASAELNSNYLFGGGNRSGSIVLNSDMQVVYTNLYPLPPSPY